ncbi:hypothetical protein C0992_003256 [Termitomyces sp. T32_za158]|nr:hypothetical protein C0992_003256 [Termitomyces sp. T32_za158]
MREVVNTEFEQSLFMSMQDLYQEEFEYFLPDGSVNPFYIETDDDRFEEQDSSQCDSTPSSSQSSISLPVLNNAFGSLTKIKGKKRSIDNKYTLSLPDKNSSNYLSAAALSSNSSIADHPRHTTPPRGNFRAAMDLIDDVGIPADEFWRMFVRCPACNYIMAGSYYKDHVCDLTEL